MKKSILLLFIVLCVFLLTGCGSKSGGQVVCSIKEEKKGATVEANITGDIDEENNVTSLKISLEGTINDEYYEQLKQNGTVDQVMNTIEQGLGEIAQSYFGSSFDYDISSRTSNNKVYVNVELKLPQGYKNWGSKQEMIDTYTQKYNMVCR